MSNFNERLRAERKRLGLNQEKFAAQGGITKDTQLNYENGSRKPDSEYLELITKAGVDVLFLFTGVRSEKNLTSDESELLDGYRTLDIRGKAGMLGMAEGLKSSPTSKNQNVIHGKVSQTVQGDQHVNAPQTFNLGSKRPKK